MSNNTTTTSVGFFDALSAVFSGVFRIATTFDKSVQLAEREVDNLAEYQEIRLDRVKAERTALLADLRKSEE